MMTFGNKPLTFAVPEPSDDTSHEGTCRAVLRKQAAEMAKAAAAAKTAAKEGATTSKDGAASKIDSSSAQSLAERKRCALCDNKTFR